MKLRVARHTTNLNAISDFYTQLLGMKVLGSFSGHDSYDGVFLGMPRCRLVPGVHSFGRSAGTSAR